MLRSCNMRALRCCRRLISTVDDRTTFSTVWQGVDSNRHDDESIVTPDPLAYLRGFDAVPATSSYRKSLLDACGLAAGSHALDVGCGLGMQSRMLAAAVGEAGTVTSIDISHDAINAARAGGVPDNVRFDVADVFSLPHDDDTFDCVLEDRVLQHLTRPLEAVKELVRVASPGAPVVVGNPDWRSFQIDVTAAGGHGEAGTRWGEVRRAEGDLAFDMGALTWRILGGVIPTLTQHSYIGLAQPRLLRAAGLEDVEVHAIPLLLRGRADLEAVVPITYMARLATNNGGVTAAEAGLWLRRLEWEGGSNLFGALSMYICVGRKPSRHAAASASTVTMGQSRLVRAVPKPSRTTVRTRHLDGASAADESLVNEVARLINDVYAISDTNVTLASPRLAVSDVEGMLARGEIFIAEEHVLSAEEPGIPVYASSSTAADLRPPPQLPRICGCVQVEVKGEGINAGLPTATGDAMLVGEFSCLAVRSFDGHSGAPTPRGVGAKLVRAAEAHCRSRGCGIMQMGILCPAAEEPAYKRWLCEWYLRLGYEHRETLMLRFEPDEVNEVRSRELELRSAHTRAILSSTRCVYHAPQMYACLKQVLSRRLELRSAHTRAILSMTRCVSRVLDAARAVQVHIIRQTIVKRVNLLCDKLRDNVHYVVVATVRRAPF